MAHREPWRAARYRGRKPPRASRQRKRPAARKGDRGGDEVDPRKSEDASAAAARPSCVSTGAGIVGASSRNSLRSATGSDSRPRFCGGAEFRNFNLEFRDSSRPRRGRSKLKMYSPRSLRELCVSAVKTLVRRVPFDHSASDTLRFRGKFTACPSTP